MAVMCEESRMTNRRIFLIPAGPNLGVQPALPTQYVRQLKKNVLKGNPNRMYKVLPCTLLVEKEVM